MVQYLEKIEKNKSYSTKIYQQIKSLIITGKLKAGSNVNEREFASMLGVSRTPLRDALTLLEKEGWVEQNGKIRMVAPLLWRNILELLEIREPIDMLGFELAFYKYTPEDFAHLHGILQEMMDVTKAGSRFLLQHHGAGYQLSPLYQCENPGIASYLPFRRRSTKR